MHIYYGVEENTLKIYAASSWKNTHQSNVVGTLRSDGHTVYDFRTEAAAFSWRVIDENWRDWTVSEYIKYLQHPASIHGFNSDFGGINSCEACVLILPCGLSAGIEAGIFRGRNLPVAVYVPEIREPELMVKCFNFISSDLKEIRKFFK